MSTKYDFAKELQFSMDAQQGLDIDIIKRHIPLCVKVEKTDVETDKTGVDYIAYLKNGAKINIDAKTRKKGASKYWPDGIPRIALECWSVVGKKIGWTLDTSTNVDYILYTFDKADCEKYFFFPFQLLRKAFWENGAKWKEKYHIRTQHSKWGRSSWKSTAMFVPVTVVIEAVTRTMEASA